MRSTPSERQAHLRAWSASGMSRAAYCRAQGLKYSTFMSWCKAERQQDGSSEVRGHFVVLPSEAVTNELGQVLEVHLPNGIRLRIPGSLTTSLLKILNNV